jgi:hypothetical protein
VKELSNRLLASTGGSMHLFIASAHKLKHCDAAEKEQSRQCIDGRGSFSYTGDEHDEGLEKSTFSSIVPVARNL